MRVEGDWAQSLTPRPTIFLYGRRGITVYFLLPTGVGFCLLPAAAALHRHREIEKKKRILLSRHLGRRPPSQMPWYCFGCHVWVWDGNHVCGKSRRVGSVRYMKAHSK